MRNSSSVLSSASSGDAGQPAGTHFIDDEQQPRALCQLIGGLPGQRDEHLSSGVAGTGGARHAYGMLVFGSRHLVPRIAGTLTAGDFMNGPGDKAEARSVAEDRVAAEAARNEAEQFRRLAEEAREARDQHRDALEAIRQEREQLRESAETARIASEDARIAAETARTAGEEARIVTDAARQAVVDAVRATADTLKVSLEQMRVVEEMRRTLREIKDVNKLEPN